jgi:site-specific DNA-cytosine methylase
MSERDERATRHCLDLFAGVGGFSAAFRDSENWVVTTVEREEKFTPDICADVFDLAPTDLPDADVILASPPCTLFSEAGNHDQWNIKERTPAGDRARKHITLVYHTLGLIRAMSPGYWYLENPRGRLRWVIGEPTGTVSYCQYGREYWKPTDLWGDHAPGMTYRYCSKGSSCHQHIHSGVQHGRPATAGMSSDHAERSKVPYELSESILAAVEGRGVQSTLTEVKA